MPTSSGPRILAVQSFAGPEANTWRWAASWASYANWVNKIPNAAAISS